MHSYLSLYIYRHTHTHIHIHMHMHMHMHRPMPMPMHMRMHMHLHPAHAHAHQHHMHMHTCTCRVFGVPVGFCWVLPGRFSLPWAGPALNSFSSGHGYSPKQALRPVQGLIRISTNMDKV